MAVGADCVLRFWDCHSGNCLEHLDPQHDTAAQGEPEVLCAVAVSPDNSTLVTADTAGSVAVWDVRDAHSALLALAAAHPPNALQRGQRPGSALSSPTRASAMGRGVFEGGFGSPTSSSSSRPQSAAAFGASPRAVRTSVFGAATAARRAVGVRRVAGWRAHAGAVTALLWVSAPQTSAAAGPSSQLDLGQAAAEAPVGVAAQDSPQPEQQLLFEGPSSAQQQGPSSQVMEVAEGQQQARQLLAAMQQQRRRQQQQRTQELPDARLQQLAAAIQGMHAAAAAAGESSDGAAAAAVPQPVAAKQGFIVSAGLDRTLVLWSTTGCKVGLFGSKTWQLEERSTWREPPDPSDQVRAQGWVVCRKLWLWFGFQSPHAKRTLFAGSAAAEAVTLDICHSVSLQAQSSDAAGLPAGVMLPQLSMDRACSACSSDVSLSCVPPSHGDPLGTAGATRLAAGSQTPRHQQQQIEPQHTQQQMQLADLQASCCGEPSTSSKQVSPRQPSQLMKAVAFADDVPAPTPGRSSCSAAAAAAVAAATAEARLPVAEHACSNSSGMMQHQHQQQAAALPGGGLRASSWQSAFASSAWPGGAAAMTALEQDVVCLAAEEDLPTSLWLPEFTRLALIRPASAAVHRPTSSAAAGRSRPSTATAAAGGGLHSRANGTGKVLAATGRRSVVLDAGIGGGVLMGGRVAANVAGAGPLGRPKSAGVLQAGRGPGKCGH